MIDDAVIEYLATCGEILEYAPLSQYTTMRVGGAARVMLFPQSIEALSLALKYVKKLEIPYKILGKGSNILVADKPFDGVVIAFQHVLDTIEIDEEQLQISVGSGFSLVKLSQIAARHNMAGLAFASGIPGTIGGAVFMNAGAHGSDTSKVVTSIDFLDECGDLKQLSTAQCQFSYRTSIFQTHKDWIIVRAHYQLERGDKSAILAQMQEWKKRRVTTQPYTRPSCGSVFRNPLPEHAGALIEALGLKGLRIGGAMVSEMHANFIINIGHATANDVMEIINTIKKKVHDTYGIDLHTEVELFNWE